MFCQKDKSGVKLFNCQTMATSTKIIDLSEYDTVMRYRLAGVHDLPAAEGKYHLSCYRAFEHKHSKPRQCGHIPEDESDEDSMSFHTVMKDLESGLKREVFSLKMMWTYYCNLLNRRHNAKLAVYHG